MIEAAPLLVELAQNERDMTQERIEHLMGRKPELRFAYIEEHARFVSEDSLDV